MSMRVKFKKNSGPNHQNFAGPPMYALRVEKQNLQQQHFSDITHNNTHITTHKHHTNTHKYSYYYKQQAPLSETSQPINKNNTKKKGENLRFPRHKHTTTMRNLTHINFVHLNTHVKPSLIEIAFLDIHSSLSGHFRSTAIASVM
jgi:hypothetical protein